MCKEKDALIFHDALAMGKRINATVAAIKSDAALGSVWCLQSLAMDNKPIESRMLFTAFVNYGGAHGRQVVFEVVGDADGSRATRTCTGAD